jgi:hypothetical protein
LTIEQLETSAYSTILGKYTLLCIYAQPVEYHTAQIKTDFPWFQDLHGWWKDNPVCNRTFSTAHPGQNFSAQAVVLFGLLESTHTPPDDGCAPHLPLSGTSFDTTSLSLAPGTMSSIAATSTSLVTPFTLSAPPLSSFSVPSSSTTLDDTHPSTDSIFNDFFHFDEDFDFAPASFGAESTLDTAIGGLTSSTMATTATLPPNTISLDGDPPP